MRENKLNIYNNFINKNRPKMKCWQRQATGGHEKPNRQEMISNTNQCKLNKSRKKKVHFRDELNPSHQQVGRDRIESTSVNKPETDIQKEKIITQKKERFTGFAIQLKVQKK